MRMSAERLGREEASCNSEVDDVFQVGRCKLKRLFYVLFSEFGILLEEVRTVGIERHRFDDSTHGHAHSTDAWLSIHLLRVCGDAVETCCGHQAAFWIKGTNRRKSIPARPYRPKYCTITVAVTRFRTA